MKVAYDAAFAEKMLAQAVQAAKAFDAHVLIRGMEPGADVVRFAREKEVNQITIGVKKRSRVGKLMFGFTAQYILLKAHCPVLFVK